MPIVKYVEEMLRTDQSGPRLGIRVDSAGEGRATARMTVADDMTNGLHLAQGGFVFALADQAFACAANSVAERTATAEASISYLSPARAGDELVAEAEVYLLDERRVVVDVIVRAGTRIVAVFRGSGRPMRVTAGDA